MLRQTVLFVTDSWQLKNSYFWNGNSLLWM